MMMTRKGFTVLEIMICIIVLAVAVVLFFMQKQNVEAMDRDDQRKSAINAMFFALEEGYYEENGYYPEVIDKPEVLHWIDPNTFTDPTGFNLWEADSDYSYEAIDCNDKHECKSYKLRAELEKEENYVRTSRH